MLLLPDVFQELLPSFLEEVIEVEVGGTSLDDGVDPEVLRTLGQMSLATNNAPCLLEETDARKKHLATKKSNSSSSVVKPTFECGMCFANCTLEDLFQPSTCDHKACRKCARKYVQSLIEQSKFLICFQPDCKKEWTIYDVQLIVDENDYDRLQMMLFNKATDTFHHCPKPNCKGVAEVVPPCRYFLCPVCNYRKCIACNNEYHPTVTCDEYRQWLEENGQADDRSNDCIKQLKKPKAVTT